MYVKPLQFKKLLFPECRVIAVQFLTPANSTQGNAAAQLGLNSEHTIYLSWNNQVPVWVLEGNND